MEISYYTRYQILNNIVNLDANNLYVFLDRETEYLTNYYKISEDIFEKIKKEKILKQNYKLNQIEMKLYYQGKENNLIE